MSEKQKLEEKWISWGPVHPASGQMRVLFQTDGENLLDLIPDIGFTHRGIEKVCEFRTIISAIPSVEKICILDASNVDLGFVKAMEELLNIRVPEKAKLLRTFMCELNRITSHLYWTSLMGAVAGFYTVLMWAINERELFLDLGAMLSKTRVSYIYIVPGGVRYDVPEGFKEKAFEILDYFEGRLKTLYDMFFNNKLFEMRTKGVGVLKKKDAIRLGAAGPTLRGSGVKMDVRKDEPYAAYEEVDFEIPVGERGDAYDRCMVRYKEMRESVKIMKQVLEMLPSGRVKVKTPWILPPGEAFSRVESARGEINFYVVSKRGANPYRVKIATPSFKNLSLLRHISKGSLVADLPILVFSLDPFPLDSDR